VVKPNCGRVVEGVNKEVAVTTAWCLACTAERESTMDK